MKLIANPEVLRRLALAAGLFAAIVFFMNPVSHILRVELMDFERKQKSFYTPASYKKLPLDEYIARETKGKSKAVSGAQWQQALQDLLQHRQGKTPEEWIENQPDSSKGRDSEFYFAPEQEPFASEVGNNDEVHYIALEQNGVKHYIELISRKSGYARDAPSAVMYPLRSYAWLPLLIGLIIYFFLPKVKKPIDSLGYGKLWGLVFSDFIGLIFAGFFFWLQLALLIEKAGSFSAMFDFETGRIWLVLFMWFISIVCLGIMWTGVWYRNFWITITPEGLLRHTHKGEQFFPYREMEKASLRQKKHHWLIALLLATGSGHPTSIGQASMLAGQKHLGININMKNRKPWWIRLEAFQNPKRLLKSLRENGVEFDESLQTV